MNLESIRIIVANGGGLLHEKEMTYLFDRIADADKVIRRIAMVSDTANQRHLPKQEEMITINITANDHIAKYEVKKEKVSA